MAPHRRRGREILDRRSDRLEKRNLIRGAAALGVGAAEREQITLYRSLLEGSALQRQGDFPTLDLRGRRVDVDPGAAERLVVGFAHGEIEGADEVEMGA